MNISFKKFSNKDNEQLVVFLTSEIWSFNVISKFTNREVHKWIKDDKFTKPEKIAYWIMLDNEKGIGIICISDLKDTLIIYPEFEMWLCNTFRNGEVIRKILQLLTDDVFNKYVEAIGISTQMRQDDLTFSQACHHCSFMKEAHRRRSWPIEKGKYYDSVEYAILREDWEQKKVTPVDWHDENFGIGKENVSHDDRREVSAQKISFKRFVKQEAEEMARFLSSDSWPYHIYSNLTEKQVMEWIKNGKFVSKGRQTYWALLNGKEKVGMFRIFGLHDPLPYCPQMDIRVKSQCRGKGIGKTMLAWLTDHIFTTMPDRIRIEGYTRQENKAMRKVFLKCGYVKEGHFRRRKTQIQKDLCYDITGYGINRDDWEQKKITPVNWCDENNYGGQSPFPFFH